MRRSPAMKLVVAQPIFLSALLAFTFLSPFVGPVIAPADGANADDYFAESTADHVRKWSSAKMPLNVYVAPGEGTRGYKPVYRQMAEDAFNAWSSASKNKVSFRFVVAPATANITFVWSSNPSDLPNKLEPLQLGETLLLNGPKGNDSARIVVLTVPPDSQVTLTDDVMRYICLHEVGHALGLSHSPDTHDTMYPHFMSELKEGQTSELSGRDINTIAHLYSEAVDANVASAALGHQAHAVTGTKVMLDANNEAAIAAANKGDWPRAIAIYQKMVNDNPSSSVCRENFAAVLNKAGNSEIRRGSYDSAIVYLKRALVTGVYQDVTKQNLSVAYLEKASGYLHSGTLTDAEIYFKAALEILSATPNDPNFHACVNNYAVTLRRMGRADEAARLEERYK